MAKYYETTIQWINDGQIGTVIFKDGDPDNVNDNNVFYYIDGEHDLEDLKKEGVEDFKVLNYEEIKEMSRPEATFTVNLQFHDGDELTDTQLAEIQEKILDALVHEVNNGQGLAPEDMETFTTQIEVIEPVSEESNLFIFPMK